MTSDMPIQESALRQSKIWIEMLADMLDIDTETTAIKVSHSSKGELVKVTVDDTLRQIDEALAEYEAGNE